MARNYKKFGFKMICIMVTLIIIFLLSINSVSSAIIRIPLILSYRASSTNVNLGDTITLNWYVLNAETVEIVGIEKAPESINVLKGSVEVWPMATTTYVLIATSKDGTISTRSITVNVNGTQSSSASKINYFLSLRSIINSGQSARLWWNTINATKVELTDMDNGSKVSVAKTGVKLVSPKKTTTYILDAYAKDGTIASKSFTINVKNGDNTSNTEIVNFSASSNQITLGDTVTLNWEVKNAVDISITGLEKTTEESLPAKDSLELWPTATTVYTLTAVGSDGTKVEKSLTVTVATSSPSPTKTIPSVSPSPSPTKSIPVVSKAPVKSIPVIVN